MIHFNLIACLCCNKYLKIKFKIFSKIKYSICSYSCPVDNYVFPGLDRLRDGDSLEARFNAFKIPESNFLVFEATVRTCRDGCQPAYCSGGTGRSEPSFGRRRRDVSQNDTIPEENEISVITKNNTNDTSSNSTFVVEDTVSKEEEAEEEEEEEEHVREMIEVKKKKK